MCDKTVVMIANKHNKQKLGIVYDLSLEETKAIVCTKQFWEDYWCPAKAWFYDTMRNSEDLIIFSPDSSFTEKYIFPWEED